MTWARLEDRFPWHRKIRPLSDAAFRLHVSGICWSTEHLTDGFVPEADLSIVSDVRNPSRCVKELLERSLWLPVDGGWEIHEYLTYNQSAEQVRASREAAAERQRRAREAAAARRESQGKSRRDSQRSSDDEAVPPSRPVPSPSSSKTSSSRKYAIGEDWQPTDDDLAWAAVKAPLANLERETESFRNYFLDKGEKRPGWSRSWQTWMLRAQTNAEVRPLRTGRKPVGDGIASRPDEAYQDLGIFGRGA